MLVAAGKALLDIRQAPADLGDGLPNPLVPVVGPITPGLPRAGRRLRPNQGAFAVLNDNPALIPEQCHGASGRVHRNAVGLGEILK